MVWKVEGLAARAWEGLAGEWEEDLEAGLEEEDRFEFLGVVLAVAWAEGLASRLCWAGLAELGRVQGLEG